MLVEVRTFRLAEGVEESTFLAADAEAQARRNPLPGFVRRTTARGAEGAWLVLTFWHSAADADAAGPEAPLDGLVDPGSDRADRYVTLE